MSYRWLLERTLRPGGHLALACFAAGHDGDGGTERDDLDLYREGSLGGGLAYGPDDLRRAFAWLHEVDLRPMRRTRDAGVYGEDVLQVALLRR